MLSRSTILTPILPPPGIQPTSVSACWLCLKVLLAVLEESWGCSFGLDFGKYSDSADVSTSVVSNPRLQQLLRLSAFGTATFSEDFPVPDEILGLFLSCMTVQVASFWAYIDQLLTVHHFRIKIMQLIFAALGTQILGGLCRGRNKWHRSKQQDAHFKRSRMSCDFAALSPGAGVKLMTYIQCSTWKSKHWKSDKWLWPPKNE